MYNMYDLNAAYESFVQRFGIEPNGLLMSEHTYQELKQGAESFIIVIKEPPTFKGIPVFRSAQMDEAKMRFVI